MKITIHKAVVDLELFIRFLQWIQDCPIVELNIDLDYGVTILKKRNNIL